MKNKCKNENKCKEQYKRWCIVQMKAVLASIVWDRKLLQSPFTMFFSEDLIAKDYTSKALQIDQDAQNKRNF